MHPPFCPVRLNHDHHTTHSDSGRAHHRGHPRSGRLRFFQAEDHRDRRPHRGGHHRRANTVPDCLSHGLVHPDGTRIPSRRDPPIPLFSLPAIDVFASNADKAVIDSASSQLSSVEGVTVSPAKCDGSSLISGSTIFGGDGSAVSSSANGTVVNAGDGSGVITEGSTTITYAGDGSGTYTNMATMLTITVDADGSGTYTTPDTTFTLDGKGSGTYTNTSSGETITNDGNGSGTHTMRTVTVINNGDGTAQVNGQKVTDAPKVDKAAKLGKFPAVESLKPVESCGTLITLEDGVLFDFGKSEIRSDASQTLKKLADVLNNAKVPAAHIYGHTDSISDEAFNQQLSEARANAVSGELKKDGVTATMDATGYGESKPVAPNENADGSDNPAGRALNRRVEIFIPAF